MTNIILFVRPLVLTSIFFMCISTTHADCEKNWIRKVYILSCSSRKKRQDIDNWYVGKSDVTVPRLVDIMTKSNDEIENEGLADTKRRMETIINFLTNEELSITGAFPGMNAEDTAMVLADIKNFPERNLTRREAGLKKLYNKCCGKHNNRCTALDFAQACL